MKKVIIVDASPRKNGNCDAIAEKMAKELKNAEVKTFTLRDETVNPCKACNACKAKDAPFCVQKDDMGALIPELDACDALVLLSPVYFGQMNGPAKTFVDRLYCFFAPAKPTMSNTSKRGKKGAVICSCGAGPADVYTKYAEEAAKLSSVMGADETRAFVCADCNEPASCMSHKKSVDGLEELAEWLGR